MSLPQIVAVVEAAEVLSAYDLRATQHLDGALDGWRAISIEDVEKIVRASNATIAALAALDEALS